MVFASSTLKASILTLTVFNGLDGARLWQEVILESQSSGYQLRYIRAGRNRVLVSRPHKEQRYMRNGRIPALSEKRAKIL